MPKEHVNPPTLFPSVQHGFSQVVITNGTRTVFVSGQTAWNADKQIVGQNLGEQCHQALRNVRHAVEAAGGTLGDIVALRIYIVSDAMSDISAVGMALKDMFTANPPTSTWIGVSALAMPEFMVEIEAVAVLE